MTSLGWLTSCRDAEVDVDRARGQEGIEVKRLMERATSRLTAGLIILVAGVCQANPPGRESQWRLTFEENFEGEALDSSKWTPGWRWGPLSTTYPMDEALAENIRISGGIATFAVTKSGPTPQGKTYGSAAATTFGKFSQKYGYFEMRAQMPAKAHGVWPSMWMLGIKSKWPANGEIDVVEYLGIRPNCAYLYNHWGADAEHHQQDGRDFVGPDFSAGFHTYAVLWTPKQISRYVDGVKVFTSTKGVFDEPMYILLNNNTYNPNKQLWDGNKMDETTVFPADYKVDYVRVWQATDQRPDEKAKADSPPGK